jgi:hypothetical protein
MIVDPAASMEVWEIQIELGGRDFTIPAMPASDWWPILAEGDLTALLDIATSDEQGVLEELILDGQISRDEIKDKLVAAVEEATGRSLHVSIVIVTAASANWALINGYLVARGFRWQNQPIAAALDALYVSVMTHLNKEGSEKFTEMLNTDTTGRPTDKRRAEVEAEFASIAGPKPKTGATATAGLSGSARPRTRRQPRLPRQDGPSGAPTRPPARPVESDPAASSESR